MPFGLCFLVLVVCQGKIIGNRINISLGTDLSFAFLSLGCKAIFLLGGKFRQDPPLAMFLRSGDVVLMAGKARECFHGKCESLS